MRELAWFKFVILAPLMLFRARPMKPILRLSLLLSLGLAACGGDQPAEPATETKPAAAPVALEVAPEVSEQERERIVANLQAHLPELAPDAIRGTPMPGIFEIQSGQAFGYVSESGRYLIEGDLVDLQTGVALTEERRKAQRVAILDSLQDDHVISYAPPSGTPLKHSVWVFTDVDCGYCRKLHSELDSYLAKGIKINYLFYPRSGPGSPSFNKAVSVWCADDPRAAMTTAKNGASIEAKSCENPVMDDYRLGQQMGLRGTPMIVLDDGEVVQGYLPAAALAARLDSAPKADPVPAKS